MQPLTRHGLPAVRDGARASSRHTRIGVIGADASASALQHAGTAAGPDILVLPPPDRGDLPAAPGPVPGPRRVALPVFAPADIADIAGLAALACGSHREPEIEDIALGPGTPSDPDGAFLERGALHLLALLDRL